MADAAKLLKDFQRSLEKAQQDLATIEKRRGIATSEANDLEAKNRAALASLNEEIEAKRAQALAPLNKEIAAKEDEIAALDAEIDLLTNESIEWERSLNQSKKLREVVAEEMNILNTQSADLRFKIAESHQQLADLGKEFEERRQMVDEERKTLYAEMSKLSVEKLHMEQDLEVLNKTIADQENNIIELDTQYKARKEYLNKQIKATETKLQPLLNKLEQSMNKDKQIRESWADGHMRLEKRENSLRQMEARLAGAEDRIKELDTYM